MGYMFGHFCSRIVTKKRRLLWETLMTAYARKLSVWLPKQSQNLQRCNKNSKAKRAVGFYRRKVLLDLGLLFNPLQQTVSQSLLRNTCCWKVRNDAKFRQDGSKAQEALLPDQFIKLAHQSSDLQRHFATIRRSLRKYRFKWSSEKSSRYWEFCRHVLESGRQYMQYRQRIIESSLTEGLAPFEQIVRTL